MSYEELLGWFNYFEKRPVDWRDDDRTYKYLQTQGVKEKPWAIFPSLENIYNKKDKPKEEGMIDMTSFKQSSLFGKMMLAVGGENVL